MTWAQRLDNAKFACEFTEDDVSAANEWTSCAIGERFNITKKEAYEEIDKVLDHDALTLGFQFMHEVGKMQVIEAEQTYLTIQALPDIARLTQEVAK